MPICSDMVHEAYRQDALLRGVKPSSLVTYDRAWALYREYLEAHGVAVETAKLSDSSDSITVPPESTWTMR